MATDEAFRDLVRRVRSGDQDAATELVRTYEPAIRRAVRVRLTSDRLRSQLDSIDVANSVLGSFFHRAALGQYDLDGPEDLLRLLATMARNKLADWARKEGAARRGGGMMRAGEDADRELTQPGPTASAVFASKELLGMALARLSEEERRVAEGRADGRSWAELATELGGTPEALRKKLERAVDRVATELGLDG